MAKDTTSNVTVVNVQSKRAEGARRFYIGRASKFGDSALGNPYSVKRYGRKKAIEMYRKWFKTVLTTRDKDKATRAAYTEFCWLYKAALAGPVELACYCAPKSCHGDTIKEALDWYLAKSLKQKTIKAASDAPKQKPALDPAAGKTHVIIYRADDSIQEIYSFDMRLRKDKCSLPLTTYVRRALAEVEKGGRVEIQTT